MNEVKHKGLLLSILVILIVLAAYFQFREYNLFQISQSRIDNHLKFLQAFNNRKTALTASDVGLIQPWMTFDYVNTIFKLPATYLKDTLNISDSSFPKISLAKYAKSKGIATSDFLVTVRNAVTGFFVNK